MIHLLLAVIYLSFISLGLPDSLLGSAWPAMYHAFNVPVSYAGIISMIVALGTVISSLQSDRLTKKLGAGKVTALSVAMTAAALFGFSVSHSFAALCLWAVPYGLGAGSVDASLNNYVALHYASRHMSWLHCMWGIGCSIGPTILGWALAGGQSWNMGYRYISFLQIGLTFILFMSLPLWKRQGEEDRGGGAQPIPLRRVVSFPGVRRVMVAFFCYCALEQTAALWACSYMVLHLGVDPEGAAGYGSLFYIGITIGRAVSGFVTLKLSDPQMVRLGQGIVGAGALVLLLPLGVPSAVAGLLLIGFGCGPIYPSMLHATPRLFGVDRSQAIIGVQMASAYVGTLAMPALFGLVAQYLTAGLMPAYLLVLLALMVYTHETLLRRPR